MRSACERYLVYANWLGDLMDMRDYFWDCCVNDLVATSPTCLTRLTPRETLSRFDCERLGDDD